MSIIRLKREIDQLERRLETTLRDLDEKRQKLDGLYLKQNKWIISEVMYQLRRIFPDLKGIQIDFDEMSLRQLIFENFIFEKIPQTYIYNIIYKKEHVVGVITLSGIITLKHCANCDFNSTLTCCLELNEYAKIFRENNLRISTVNFKLPAWKTSKSFWLKQCFILILLDRKESLFRCLDRNVIRMIYEFAVKSL